MMTRGPIALLLLVGALLPSLLSAQQATPEGLLLFQSSDGQFRLQFDARVFLDAAFYDEDKNEQSNGVELRRGRLAILSRLWKDWTSQLDVEFADNQVEMRDAWISYEGFDSSSIKVGNFKEPFSLEELTSSRYITFMERALPNAFAPGRHIGIGYSRWGKSWQAAAGLFGQSVGDIDRGEDQGYGVTGRFSIAPLREKTKTVHLAVAGSFRTPEADAVRPDRARFRSRPEAHVDRARYLDTGRFRDVRHFTLYGVEAAAVFGPLSVQGEYIQSNVQRKRGSPNVRFDGAYAFVSWFVTGESRTYLLQDGEFGRLIPKRKSGALEIALRYSTLDLNDFRGRVTGGEGRNVTLGANWYLNPNVRIMANYVIVDNDKEANADGSLLGDDDFKVFQVRFQLNF